MATKLPPDGDTNDGIANTDNRHAAQNRHFERMFDLEQRIAELKDEHIKPLQDDLKKIRRDCKSDCDIDSKDLKINYAIYKRTREAEAMEDEADRDRILGNLRDAFAGMAKGGQLNWLDAALTDAGYVKNGAGREAA